jgi:Na+/H+ antiporter NhaC
MTGTDWTGNDEQYVRTHARSWAAATPYLVGAVVAWGAAIVTNVELIRSETNPPTSETYTPTSPTKLAIFQSLQQVLLWAGAASMVVGLLVIALRQHERWRQELHDLETIADEAVRSDVEQADAFVAADETSAYAGNNWDESKPR